jgi:cytochrome c
MTRRTLLMLLAGLGAALPARAQAIPDLKTAPDSATVREARYCRGQYELTFLDGSSRMVMELNLRIKTDSGANGPHKGKPVVLPAGMMGDRLFLIFAEPEEISGFIRRC